MNPPYRPGTQGNPFKLLLDMVPSSSENATHVTRGQPKQLFSEQPETKWYIVLISFHSTDVFCALGRLMVTPDFRLFCSRLAICYLTI